MKEYQCIEVGHHKNIAGACSEQVANGWRLHTYQATGFGTDVKHYLLFEKGTD